MVVERDPHALLAAEHLAGHECVEDPRAGQREAEVEAKEPPVLDFLIKLEQNKHFAAHFVFLRATVQLYSSATMSGSLHAKADVKIYKVGENAEASVGK